jgi:hypothetical protein
MKGEFERLVGYRAVVGAQLMGERAVEKEFEEVSWLHSFPSK